MARAIALRSAAVARPATRRSPAPDRAAARAVRVVLLLRQSCEQLGRTDILSSLDSVQNHLKLQSECLNWEPICIRGSRDSRASCFVLRVRVSTRQSRINTLTSQLKSSREGSWCGASAPRRPVGGRSTGCAEKRPPRDSEEAVAIRNARASRRKQLTRARTRRCRAGSTYRAWRSARRGCRAR